MWPDRVSNVLSKHSHINKLSRTFSSHIFLFSIPQKEFYFSLLEASESLSLFFSYLLSFFFFKKVWKVISIIIVI